MSSVLQKAQPSRLCVEDMVEALEFGPAQLLVLFLGPMGVHFVNGAVVVLVNLVATSTAAEFGLHSSEKASLSMALLAGFTIGIWVSGFLGDRRGRKLPIVIGYGMASLFGFTCAAVQQYRTLLILRVILGIGMGLGMAPSITLLSEITPQSWRMVTRASQTSAFAFGGVVASFLAALDDAELLHLDWRLLMVATSLAPATLFVFACKFLSESPVWLASLGQRSAAEHGFEEIKRQNGLKNCDSRYLSQEKGDLPSTLRIQDQFKVIFSPSLRLTTFIYLFTSLVLNLIVYGDHYKSPQVFAESGLLPAGWQALLRNSFTVCCQAVLFGLARRLRPAALLDLGLAMCALSCLSLTCAESKSESGFFYALLFQFGANLPVGTANWGFAALFQLGVDLYPPVARTTGVAVIVGGGPLAGIAAPLVVEMTRAGTGSSVSFYSAVAVLALFALLLHSLFDDRSTDEAIEESTLIGAHRTAYGCCQSP